MAALQHNVRVGDLQSISGGQVCLFAFLFPRAASNQAVALYFWLHRRRPIATLTCAAPHKADTASQ